MQEKIKEATEIISMLDLYTKLIIREFEEVLKDEELLTETSIISYCDYLECYAIDLRNLIKEAEQLKLSNLGHKRITNI